MVKLNSGLEMIEKMGETVEFMAEQREGVSWIPELFRGAELLAGDMERLETLCHCSASAPLSGRQVSLTSQHFTYRSNSDRNFCRQEHLQVHCLPICSSYSPLILRRYVYVCVSVCVCVCIYIYIYKIIHGQLISCNKFLPTNNTVHTRSASNQCTITQVQFKFFNIILSANR